MAFLAVMGAMLLYGGGNWIFLKNREIPFSVFIQTGVLLWLGSIPLYLEHLFLNLCFSKAVSSGIFHRADIAQRTFSYRTWGWKMAVRSRKLVGKRSALIWRKNFKEGQILEDPWYPLERF